MTFLHLAGLILLAALWGASFLFIRVAAPPFGPVALMAARLLVAALALGIPLALAGRREDLRAVARTPGSFLALGALNVALPFTLIAFAELRLTASMAAILNATTPLFGAAAAAWRLHEPMSARKAFGLGLGFLGVVVLVGWNPLPLTPWVVLSVAASLGAAVAYAFGAAYASSRTFEGSGVFTLATGQLLGGAVVLLPLAGFSLPPAPPPGPAVASLLALAVLCTSLAYLIYFPLLKRVGPTRTLTVTFLVPVFGTLWGALFLDEAVGAATVLGLTLILLSILFVTEPRRAASAPQPAPSVSEGGRR
ncbi:membrane protein [Limnochorda pilosa]|uniref:Membrane protein n=2 Tax=Limnochorda pilosa TaxID=1555112 RepID=A0A0K2SKY8_LIMPI|nr:membrane protein [Limnochorda pilosa]